jgi:hypothetical protein
VFSTQAQNVSFISQTSVGSELPSRSNNYPYSQTTVADSSPEATGSSEDEIPKRFSDFSLREKEELSSWSQYPNNSQSQIPAPSSSQSRQSSSDCIGKPLEERFAKIWRGFSRSLVVSRIVANAIIG